MYLQGRIQRGIFCVFVGGMGIYGPCGLRHVGLLFGFLGYHFEVINDNSNTYLIHIIDEDIVSTFFSFSNIY